MLFNPRLDVGKAKRDLRMGEDENTEDRALRLYYRAAVMRSGIPTAVCNIALCLKFVSNDRQCSCERIRKHSLAASGCRSRALTIISRSVNTNSRTRASSTDRRARSGCGFATTASNTTSAFGCSVAAQELAAVWSRAYAPWGAHTRGNQRGPRRLSFSFGTSTLCGARAPSRDDTFELFITGYRRSPEDLTAA